MIEALARDGYVRLTSAELRAALAPLDGTLEELAPSWNDLPQDSHLRDGGRYRFRRHACFIHDLARGLLVRTPHRAHWQPTTYNALHGGLERWFEPVSADVAGSTAWTRLLIRMGEGFAELQPTPRWHIEAHQFRIDTASGIGRPTPEGAHRDGVDYIAIVLVGRHRVRGGETRVFPVGSDRGVRFTLREPWSALLLDDARVVHETTPIQSDDATGWRDTLVLTYRASGFQSP